jgi:phosphomannomutase / phosphoglucomutase
MDPWKACDIRGRFPEEVSPELFRLIGHGVASMLPLGSRILVAGDFRTSTPILKNALMEGLLGSGGSIMDIQLLPTPVSYFSHRYFHTDAVLIVTASHNPAENNGLKLMMGNLPPSPEDFARLRARLAEGGFRVAPGSIQVVDAIPSYLQWVTGRWKHLAQAHPPAVVLDAGNGAWSELAPRVFAALGVTAHLLFCQLDGSYPNRPPDCARPSDVAALRSETVKTKATLGIAWDGDGDRVGFVDEAGEFVTSDEVSSIFARHLLKSHPGAKVVHDVKMSTLIRRTVLEAGGIPLLERSGHAFIKRRMIEEDCLFGCEASGHYFYRELEGGDDGLFSALLMAEIVAKAGSLKELRRTLAPFFITPDLRLPASALPFSEFARRLRVMLPAASETTVDGLRLETPEGSVLVRESVTEPVVTMRLEGSSDEALGKLLAFCHAAFPEVSAEIARQIPKPRRP